MTEVGHLGHKHLDLMDFKSDPLNIIDNFESFKKLFLVMLWIC